MEGLMDESKQETKLDRVLDVIGKFFRRREGEDTWLERFGDPGDFDEDLRRDLLQLRYPSVVAGSAIDLYLPPYDRLPPPRTEAQQRAHEEDIAVCIAAGRAELPTNGTSSDLFA